jgi:hypothetical protein
MASITHVDLPFHDILALDRGVVAAVEVGQTCPFAGLICKFPLPRVCFVILAASEMPTSRE